MPKAPEKKEGISPRLFYALFAGLLGTNVITGVAFMMSPDIATMMSGQNDLVLSAYEDRIAQLRVEVDRLHSRHYAQAGDINLQLQELAQQQEVLSEQHQYVELLAKKAAELGIAAAPPPAAPDDGPVTSAEGPSDDDSDAPLITGSIAAPGSPEDEIQQTATSIHAMMGDTQMALAALSVAATTSTDDILGQLKRVGIRPELREDGDAEGMGGPLLPPQDTPNASLLDQANAVMDALSRYKAARDAMESAPVHQPLANARRVSSGYGNRRDPFTHGRAFHAGIDFPQPQGTVVMSAGDGVVSFVGQRSGYGNCVEVDHGNGLITRYGHLSAFLVKEGQAVKTGSPIAKVGSTGRSTGPHLHFEVRRNDVPVDPAAFLAVGRALQRYVASASNQA
jgi:murein DD-endopeptidase MepM/ murein hydrolase activator NlpD